ncbi:MAG: hypothetical protein ABJB66_05920 [Gemmatimonadaceae bacterium]
MKKLLPSGQPFAFFLPKSIVFHVSTVQDYLDVRTGLSELATRDAAFTFAIDLHDTRDTFSGHAFYSLPPNFDAIVS